MAGEPEQGGAVEESAEPSPAEDAGADTPQEVAHAPAVRGGSFVRYAGWLGVFAAVVGIAGVLAATALCGPGCGGDSLARDSFDPDGSFSWSSNALSDLGVSQVAPLFNGALILVGILNFVFALGFVRAYARDLLFYAGGVFLIAGGGSLSLVGLFTEETGSLHSLVSLGYFLLFPIAMVLVGIAFLRMDKRVKGAGTIVAGLIALVVILSSVITAWHRSIGVGFAVPEIIEAFFIAGWIMWMGLMLARSG